MTIHLDPARRHDFVLLFDVQDGNPNGDPDMDNQPRTDQETGQGLMTDVAIKRKVRDYVDVVGPSVQSDAPNSPRLNIYVQRGVALNAQHRRAYTALGLKSTGQKQDRKDVEPARDWMCRNFWDIRMFGAVMATKVNAGQVRGPVQITFARSVDPISVMDVTITRVAVTAEESGYRAEPARSRGGRQMGLDGLADEADGRGDGDAPKMVGKESEMGRKAIVPYGLYRAHGFFSPHLAGQTGVTAQDLELFWDALVNMWDLDRSAARGLMACRGVYIFSHESSLGNAPTHTLLERVVERLRPEVETPRGFGDYTVAVRDGDLPPGVTLTMLGV